MAFKMARKTLTPMPVIQPAGIASIASATPVISPKERVRTFAANYSPKITGIIDPTTGKSYVTTVKNASLFAVMSDNHADLGRTLYFFLQPGILNRLPILRVKRGSENIISVMKRKVINSEGKETERKVINIPQNNIKEWLSNHFEVVERPGMQILLLGDYIDRGMQSLEVIDFIQWLSAEAAKKGMVVHVLTGNHEKLFLRFVHDLRHRSTYFIESLFKGNCCGLDSKDVDMMMQWYFVAGETISSTYESLKARYLHDKRYISEIGKIGADSWQTIVKLLDEDGYLAWMNNLKAAVIVDNNLFMHGGPVFTAKDPKQLNAHFARLFSNPANPWAPMLNYDPYTGLLIPFPSSELGDHSVRYVASYPEQRIVGWGDNILTFTIESWLAGYGADRMFVGHSLADTVRLYLNKRVVLVDATLSQWYDGGQDGALIIVDPANENPAVLISDVKGHGLMAIPLNLAKTRSDLLRNDISSYADKVYGSATGL